MKHHHTLSLVCLLALVLCGCMATPQAIIPATSEIENVTDLPPAPKTLTLVAVGDNILHNTVYQSAKTEDGYDFMPIYQPIAHLISSADIAFINQEAPMGGEKYPPSSYPNFNSPQEIGRDLVNVGFDVINLANNHIMDKGAQATLNSLAYLQTLPCTTIGAYPSDEARHTPTIIEKNGITVGFLGYTYGTNGIPLPKDQPYLVGLIDREHIRQDIAQLRPLCDFLIVSMHWGNEYHLTPNDEQKSLAQFLADLGTDIIIGTHPHVIQPAQWLTASDGTHQTFVTYSLGNFLSSQSRTNTMLGGMLIASLEKTADGRLAITTTELLPLVTHFDIGAKNYRVYPLDQYTSEMALNHHLRRKNADLNPEYFRRLAEQVWGEFYLESMTSAEILLQE